MVRKATKCRATSSKKEKYPEIEIELNKELLKMREDGVNINGDLIIAHARAITIQKNVLGFRGSRGWMYNFLRRKLPLKFKKQIYII